MNSIALLLIFAALSAAHTINNIGISQATVSITTNLQTSAKTAQQCFVCDTNNFLWYSYSTTTSGPNAIPYTGKYFTATVNDNQLTNNVTWSYMELNLTGYLWNNYDTPGIFDITLGTQKFSNYTTSGKADLNGTAACTNVAANTATGTACQLYTTKCTNQKIGYKFGIIPNTQSFYTNTFNIAPRTTGTKRTGPSINAGARISAGHFGINILAEVFNDPIFKGFRGQVIRFNGHKDMWFNVYNDPFANLNAYFIASSQKTFGHVGTVVSTYALLLDGNAISFGYSDLHFTRDVNSSHHGHMAFANSTLTVMVNGSAVVLSYDVRTVELANCVTLEFNPPFVADHKAPGKLIITGPQHHFEITFKHEEDWHINGGFLNLAMFYPATVADQYRLGGILGHSAESAYVSKRAIKYLAADAFDYSNSPASVRAFDAKLFNEYKGMISGCDTDFSSSYSARSAEMRPASIESEEAQSVTKTVVSEFDI